MLFGGRVAKDAPGPAAYGAVDEAVAALGLARAELDDGSELADLLVRLQRELFVVGAQLPGWGPAPGITHMMFPARRALVPAVRRLIDFLVENLDSDEPHDLAG